MHAAARGLPVVRRGELLAEVLRDRRLVAVVGAHGKTTTTAMLITALRRAGVPCGWLLGGLFNDEAVPPGRVGSNDWVVAEIDESDGTIDGFAPEITVIVNLDWDHPDHYPRIEQLEQAFRGLVARTRGRWCMIRGARFPCGRSRAPTWRAFSFGANGDFGASLVRETDTHLAAPARGRLSAAGRPGPGPRGVQRANATAALAAAQLMGAKLAPDLLADYPGVRRRQEVLRATDRLTVLEDYAHHPAEIRALLTSLRERKTGRLVVVFQPHRFSRTAQFKAEFAAALGLADQLFLLDVYPAGEAPVAGGTTADIYAEIKKSGAPVPVTYLPGRDGIFLGVLRAALQPGRLVAFVGAGDIDHLAPPWWRGWRPCSARAEILGPICRRPAAAALRRRRG